MDEKKDPKKTKETTLSVGRRKPCPLCGQSHYKKNCPTQKDVAPFINSKGSNAIMGNEDGLLQFARNALNHYDILKKQKSALESWRENLKKNSIVCEEKLTKVDQTMKEINEACPLFREF